MQPDPKPCDYCNGTGDLGGNPSYGVCEKCGGSGKDRRALPAVQITEAQVEAAAKAKWGNAEVQEWLRGISVPPRSFLRPAIEAALAASLARPAEAKAVKVAVPDIPGDRLNGGWREDWL